MTVNITVGGGSAPPPLPPGFQLEPAPQGAPGANKFLLNVPAGAPPLPPGFQLENAPAAPQPSIGDQLSAGFSSGVKAIPFVGPAALSGLEQLKATVQGRTPEDVAASDQAQVEQNPTAATVGTVAGNVLPFMVGGEIPAVAKVLGMDAAMPLLARTLASGGSQAAITFGDQLSRGESLGQAGFDAGVAGLGGMAAPGVGDFIGHMVGGLGNKVAGAWDAVTNTDRAAGRVVNGAAAQDVKAGAAMSPVDEASAAANSQPVINADRYGQNVRTLSRTAANADPTAEQALKAQVEQRFLTQGNRAKDFVTRTTGGNVDDLALQDSITQAARQSNRGAYNRAYADPNAQAVFTPELAQLFQSPTFRKAVQDATATASEDAALNGGKAVKNPFVFDAQGAPSLRVNPDGSKAIPNLQFWDIVQRNLRMAGEKAARVPDGLSDATKIGQLRGKLLDQLDGAVPAFKVARTGAAAAFGAEDAIDAGRKFVSQKMGIPEARRAYAKFTPEERKAFATGFASELIDKINATRDRVNVINQVFGSPAARSQVELALGSKAAGELEQFVRVEDIMDMTRHAVSGNSTTAKQLIASGLIGGGIGGAVSGWDPREMASGALFMAAGRAGVRAMGKAVDQKVMQKVAEMLTSADPKAMQQAMQSAQMSPAFRTALQAIERGLSAAVKGETIGAMRPAPTMITVNGGSSPTSVSAP